MLCCRGVRGSYGENAPTCVNPSPSPTRFCDDALPWLQGNKAVRSPQEVPDVGSWPGRVPQPVLGLPTTSSGLLLDVVAARAVALLVRGPLGEGKLIHLGRLLFHAEVRLCVGGGGGTETEGR